jgi:hypothetical protein
MGIVVKSAQIMKLKVFEIDVSCTVFKKILWSLNFWKKSDMLAGHFIGIVVTYVTGILEWHCFICFGGYRSTSAAPSLRYTVSS